MPNDTWENPLELLPLHLVALSLAEDYIGVRETETNWGPEVEKFLGATDIHVPAPWCLAFVNEVAEEAAFIKGVTSPLEEVKLQAYTPSYYEWAKEQDRIIPPEEAGPGDIFLLWYNFLDPARYGHGGFVTEVDEKEGVFYTIEGNTNFEGEREGIMVLDRKRAITRNVVFIRWDP